MAALRFDIVSHDLTIGQSAHVRKLYETLDGQADVKADGTAHFVKGEFRLETVNGQAAVRSMMTFTLSCDHRVIDGARAAAFLNDLVEAVRTSA